MKKVFIVIALSSLLSIIAGIYGILHDIITYNISSEYYTKFKFIEFDLTDAYGQPHISILQLLVITGWTATWWIGMIAGILFSAVSLSYTSTRKIVSSVIRAAAIMIVVSIVFAMLGYLAGLISNKFQIINLVDLVYLRDSVKNVDYFNIAGFIHNFIYIGGVLGIIVGCADIVRRKHMYKAKLIIDNFNK